MLRIRFSQDDPRMSDPYAAALVPFVEPLEAGFLLAEAEQATGLADWGGHRWDEERFRHDLALMCREIEETGGLSVQGRSRAHSRLMTMLVSRLRYLDARKAATGVDAERIVAPLVGTGMPRAGTTFLHGLLSQDPDLRVARACEAAMPAPLPLPGGAGDGRTARYAELLAFQGMTDPDLTQIHPFGSALPEECIFLQEADCGALYSVYWTIPQFRDAIADKTGSAFRWQIGVMQYLQATVPGRRWVLKAPGHMFVWDEMRMAFPDARIFVNHRDPGKIAPSIASLFVALRRLFSDTAVDPAMVGAEQLAAWSWAMNRYADWRSGEGRDADIFDVRFRDLTARPMDLVAELYDHFSMVLSATAREHMLRHLDHDHHAKAPQRTYTLAEFGMSEAMIEQQFARYIAHFGIQREQRR